MSEKNVEIVRAAYERAARGEFDFGDWAEDFEFVTSPELPDAGVYRGEEARVARRRCHRLMAARRGDLPLPRGRRIRHSRRSENTSRTILFWNGSSLRPGSRSRIGRSAPADRSLRRAPGADRLDSGSHFQPKEAVTMVLSTAKVEDFDRFLETFTTKGAEKRKEHGSRGSHVFRDPNDDSRAWVVFDLDEASYQNLLSDPDMPAIFEEAGLQGRPQTAELVREHDA